MADARPQTYETHRNFPAFFFRVAVPIALVALGFAMAVLWRERSLTGVALVAGAIGVMVTQLAARNMANTVQDRVIRLEMRLRLRDVLPPALQARAGELTRRQLVGLRFASDGELPGLVERCLAGELKGSEAIKREIRAWQADHLRA